MTTTTTMTDEQLRAVRRSAMDRGDHFGVSLCNRALDVGASAPERGRLAAEILAREDLRDRVLGGEA